MRNILTRAISGAVYVALIVCSIVFFHPWGFPVLCAVFALLGFIEFRQLCCHESQVRTPLLLDVAGGLDLTLIPLALHHSTSTALVLLGLFVVYLMTRLITQLYSHHDKPLRAIAVSFMSQLYIALPLALASAVFLYGGAPEVLAMFVMIWLNDTGAFLVGSAIGRHRLFERISPKKSWEGFFGGLAFTVGGAFLVKYAFGTFAPALSIWQLCIMAAIVTAFATWGDLVESLMKRTVHVKDSGHLIPGHGGILDRIDSLLLVAPALFCYIVILSLF